MINQWAANQSTLNFTLPNEFVPERWLGDPRFKDDHIDAFQPYSVGPRNCIGKKFEPPSSLEPYIITFRSLNLFMDLDAR